MDDGGQLMMFTDASSNDGHLTSAVSALALSKDVKIIPVAFGSCSPIDPGYIRLANETEGQIFVLSPDEAGNITKLADFIIRANSTPRRTGRSLTTITYVSVRSVLAEDKGGFIQSPSLLETVRVTHQAARFKYACRRTVS